MAIWIAILLSTVAVFLIITVVLLPRMFLHDKCSVTETHDRGIKRYKDADGESVLYEPVQSMRKYIKQYVIADRDGQKSLVCKLARKLEYIDFDVVVFNADGAVRGIFNVKEKIRDKSFTCVVELPPDTSYVSLSVNGADDSVFEENRVLTKVSGVKIALFSVIATLLTGLAVVGVVVSCAHIFGGVYGESLLYTSGSRLVIFIIVIAAMVVDFLLNIILLSVRNKNAGKRKGKSL